MTARDHGRMEGKLTGDITRVVSVTQDVYNLGSFIMFLNVRKNP